MNLVDSSGWLEFFADGANAAIFAKPIEQLAELIVPSITITEVFKRILQQRDEQAALQATAHMNQGRVVALDGSLAMMAAKLGYDLKLPLADSIILATARAYDALLWTQDDDFRNLPHVRYVPKS
jgi:toxin FitB